MFDQAGPTSCRLVEANGELAARVIADSESAMVGEQQGCDGDIAHMKSSAESFLSHADKCGADTVASAAVQVWRSAQRKLDNGSIPDREQSLYLSAVAESAQVAGWLLFDAGRWDAARTAFMESHILADHAGDRAKKWFALDMLAMLDIEIAQPGEALRIAESVLSEKRVPPRVALIARVRRGRALALMGDGRRSAADLDAAKVGLEGSLSPLDPWWVWWSATPRGALLYRSDLLRGYATVKAWREVEHELEGIARLLGVINSGRNRRALRESLRLIERDRSAPAWLASLAMEVQAGAA